MKKFLLLMFFFIGGSTLFVQAQLPSWPWIDNETIIVCSGSEGFTFSAETNTVGSGDYSSTTPANTKYHEVTIAKNSGDDGLLSLSGTRRQSVTRTGWGNSFWPYEYSLNALSNIAINIAANTGTTPKEGSYKLTYTNTTSSGSSRSGARNVTIKVYPQLTAQKVNVADFTSSSIGTVIPPRAFLISGTTPNNTEFTWSISDTEKAKAIEMGYPDTGPFSGTGAVSLSGFTTTNSGSFTVDYTFKYADAISFTSGKACSSVSGSFTITENDLPTSPTITLPDLSICSHETFGSINVGTFSYNGSRNSSDSHSLSLEYVEGAKVVNDASANNTRGNSGSVLRSFSLNLQKNAIPTYGTGTYKLTYTRSFYYSATNTNHAYTGSQLITVKVTPQVSADPTFEDGCVLTYPSNSKNTIELLTSALKTGQSLTWTVPGDNVLGLSGGTASSTVNNKGEIKLNIPALTGENNSATITYTISEEGYCDLTRTLVVNVEKALPGSNPDITGAIDREICLGDALDPIVVGGFYSGSSLGDMFTNGSFHEIEITKVTGNDVLSLTVDNSKVSHIVSGGLTSTLNSLSLALTPIASGTGVYRLTYTRDLTDRSGSVDHFDYTGSQLITITVGARADASKLRYDDGAVLVYPAGGVVPEINLLADTKTLAVGESLKWEVKGTPAGSVIGMEDEDGSTTIPKFNAADLTDQTEVTIEYTLEEEDLCDVVRTLTLVVAPVEEEEVCSPNRFEDPAFVERTNVAIKATDVRTISIEKISGDDNVIGFANASITQTGSFGEYAATTFPLAETPVGIGTATYLLTEQIGINGVADAEVYYRYIKYIRQNVFVESDLTYADGDHYLIASGATVPNIVLADLSDFPDGTVVEWEVISTQTGESIGMEDESGTGVTILGFDAKEFTTQTEVTIEYTLSLTGYCKLVQTLILVVVPVVEEDACGEDDLFDDPEFPAFPSDDVQGTDVRKLSIKKVSGDDNVIGFDNESVTQGPAAPGFAKISLPLDATAGIGQSTYLLTDQIGIDGVADAKVNYRYIQYTRLKAFDETNLTYADGEIALYRAGQEVDAIELLKSDPLPTGTSIKWEVTGMPNGASIGMSENGTATTIPEFTATEVTVQKDVTVTYTLSGDYEDYCEVERTLIIRVIPDADFTICNNAEYDETEVLPADLLGEYNGGETSDDFHSYSLILQDGVAVIEDISEDDTKQEYDQGSNTLPAITVDLKETGGGVYGTGIYLETYTRSIAGETSTIQRTLTLTTLQELDDKMIIPLSHYTTMFEGVTFSKLPLNKGTLPEGATISWEVTDETKATAEAMGLDTSGTGFIPEFTPQSTGAVYIDLILAYDDYDCEKVESLSHIMMNVLPWIGGNESAYDPFLRALPLNGQIIHADDVFGKMLLEASYDGAKITGEDLKFLFFRVEFVGGTQVLDLPTGEVPAGEWIPTRSANKYVGSGTYKIVPFYYENASSAGLGDATIGEPAYFTMEVRNVLTIDMAGPVDDLVFENGDFVSGFIIGANLPFGSQITWKLKDDSEVIGMQTTSGGWTVLPFRAVNTGTANRVATIIYTISYTDGFANTSEPATGSFTITVKPKTIESFDLIAQPISDQTICMDDEAVFSNITLGATFFGSTQAATKFRINFLGGTQVAELPKVLQSAGNYWKPKVLKVGKGTYEAIPYYNNFQGQAVRFTLEAVSALDPLDATLTNLAGQTFSYRNGDLVSSGISLSEGLPAGIRVKWKAKDEDKAKAIGLTRMEGYNYIPSFTALNGTEEVMDAEFTFTLEYLNKPDCASTEDPERSTFKIEVLPFLIADPYLSMNTVSGQIICFDDNFKNMSFLAERDDPFTGSEVSYLIQFLSGTDVVGLNSGSVSNGVSADPGTAASWNLSEAPSVSGTGTYRVIPKWNNTTGTSTIFTLTRLPELASEFLNAYLSHAVTYKNGDLVQAIDLSAGLPEGVTVEWAKTGDQISSSAENSTSGVNVIPAFRAVNKGSSLLKATYTLSLRYTDSQYEDCDEAEIGTFIIEVEPQVIENKGLLMNQVKNQTICYNGEFTKALFSVFRLPAYPADEAVSTIEYRVEFVSGTDVAGLNSGDASYKVSADSDKSGEWTPAKTTVGTGMYRVTPYWKNEKGEPVLFTLTRMPELATSYLASYLDKTVTYKNGDFIPLIDFSTDLPEGVLVTWVHSDESDVIATGQTRGEKGLSSIPAFTAVNYGTERLEAVYTLTLKYADPELSDCTLEAGTFTIQVEAKTLIDKDLIMSPVANQKICFTDDFDPALFLAKREPSFPQFNKDVENEVTYRVEFVEGIDVAGLTGAYVSPSVSAAPTQEAEWTLSKSYRTAGTGTYRVTPRWSNGEGESVVFTLTRMPELKSSDLGNYLDKVVTYKNGDQIQAIDLSASLPEGVVAIWKHSGDVIASDQNLHETGTNIIPAFRVVNTTSYRKEAVYSITLAYADPELSSCKLIAGTFTIQVESKTVEDKDLIMDLIPSQVVCFDEKFKNVLMLATRMPDSPPFHENTNKVRYYIELIDGVDVAGLTTSMSVFEILSGEPTQVVGWEIEQNTVVGTGTYRVTPRWSNGEGVPVVFSLTRLPELSPEGLLASFVNKTVTYKNGDYIPQTDLTFALPEGVIATWEHSGDALFSGQVVGETGVNVIPAFRAENITPNVIQATFTLTLEYAKADKESCSVVAGTYKIRIEPRTLIDRDLFVRAVESQTICYLPGAYNFDPIELTALRVVKSPSFPGLSPVSFKIDFVSGVQVLDLQPSTITVPDRKTSGWWQPITAMDHNNNPVAGEGTYRITPYWANGEGVPTIVTFTVRQKLNIEDINLVSQELVYDNGDFINQMVFDGTNPAGTIIKWKNTGDNIGSSMNGRGSIPAFRAKNVTKEPLVAVYKVEMLYPDNLCSSVSGTLTITVNPKHIQDIDLNMSPVADQNICNGEEIVFDPILFKAYRTDAKVFDETTADVEYTVSFVEGVNILNLTENFQISGTAGEITEWLPTLAYDEKDKSIVGTGLYRVTPRWNNNEGQSVVFSLTLAPVLDNDAIVLENKVYNNGQSVPEFTFTGVNIPQDASIVWRLKDEQPEIGTERNGVNIIPAFTAVNLTNAIVVAEYEVWLEYKNCTTADFLKTFTISVLPKHIQDIDLNMSPIADQSICNEEEIAFDPILFKAYRTDAKVFDETTADVEYIVSFLEGSNILNLTENFQILGTAGEITEWLPTLAYDENEKPIVGTGLYCVTPRWNNNEGQSVVFSLTLAPVLDNGAIVLENKVYNNGQSVPKFTFTGVNIPQGASIVWRLKDEQPEVGTEKNGVDFIPAFTAVNLTNKTVVAEYEVWLEYENCTTTEFLKTFTISVLPATTEDPDFWVVKLPNQAVCAEDAFVNVTLTAKHRFTEVDELTNVRFEWNLIQGDDILGLGTEGFFDATGNETEWLLSEMQKNVGQATYNITPIWQNKRGTSSQIMLTRYAKPQVDQINDIVLCNAEGLSVSFTGKTAGTEFDWVSEGGSALGVPASGSNAINIQKLYNNGATPVYVTFTVTPRNQDTNCVGDEMSFKVIVLPTPIVSAIPNIALANGETLENNAVEFTGIANAYHWINNNPAIYADHSTPVEGTVKANANGKFFLPGFKVQNASQEPITAKFIVTPLIIDEITGHVCTGTPTEFHIIIAPKPILSDIANVHLCAGEMTTPITPEGLPAGSGYFITWTGGASVGLADGIAANRSRSIPAFKAKANGNILTTAEVTVTPWVVVGSVEYAGEPVKFTYSVVPPIYLSEPEGSQFALESCTSDNLILDVYAEGHNLTYQWYKDHVEIPGATSNQLLLSNTGLNDTGEYYAVVNSECESVRSLSYIVKVRVPLVSQRWGDVLTLNCNPSENGGFNFVSFQWYRITADGKVEKMTAENRSYYYKNGGFETGVEYFVEAVTSDGTVYESCPIEPTANNLAPMFAISPNPVKAGQIATLVANLSQDELNKLQIHLINSGGRILSTMGATGTETKIQMPSVPGVYLVRLLPDRNTMNAVSLKVIVK